MNAFYKLPKNLLKLYQFKRLKKIHGGLGLGIFFDLFFMCGECIHTGYILQADNDLYKLLAKEAKITSRPYQVKKILDTMANLEILDITLYKMNIIFIPILYKTNEKYFITIFNNDYNDEQNKIIENWKYLFRIYNIEKNAVVDLQDIKNVNTCKIETCDNFIDYIKSLLRIV